jgi:hypothetical protein
MALDAAPKAKFDAYFAFTSSGACNLPRSVADPGGGPWFIYPDQTMIADLVFLWSLFSDVYEILGRADGLANIIQADKELTNDFRRIIQGSSPADPDGSFWHFPKGQVPLSEALGTELPNVLRTLRNSYAHSHWLYENLSALDYWTRLGWQTANADPRFDLANRPAKNYMLYLADAKPWKPQDFWTMNPLRILVTHSTTLRYHLHLFLNYVLNGSRADVFQH